VVVQSAGAQKMTSFKYEVAVILPGIFIKYDLLAGEL